MRFTYDREANATYIYITDIIPGDISSTDSFEMGDILSFGSVNIDFDKQGRILGFEIMCAREMLEKKLLKSAVNPLSHKPFKNPDVSVDYDKNLNTVSIFLAKIQKEDIESDNTFEIEDLLKKGQVHLGFNNDQKLLRIRIADAEKLLPKKFLREALGNM